MTKPLRPGHQGVQALVRDLNRLYRGTPALRVKDAQPEGGQWVATGPAKSSYGGVRRGDAPGVVACNFTPCRIGVLQAGRWRLAVNTDATACGEWAIWAAVVADGELQDGQPASMAVTLPPL